MTASEHVLARGWVTIPCRIAESKVSQDLACWLTNLLMIRDQEKTGRRRRAQSNEISFKTIGAMRNINVGEIKNYILLGKT